MTLVTMMTFLFKDDFVKSISFAFASLFLFLVGCSSHSETPVHPKKQESLSYQKKTPRVGSPLFNEDIMHTSAKGWRALYVDEERSAYINTKAVKTEGNIKSVILVNLYHAEKPFIIEGLHEYDCSKPNTFRLTQMKTSGLNESNRSEIIQSKNARWEVDSPRSLNTLVWSAVCGKTESLLPVLETSSTFADLLNPTSKNVNILKLLYKDGYFSFRFRQ